MRQLTLGDLKLGLTDLLGKRRPALELTSVGQRYASMLQAKLDRIAALPPALLGGKALAAELDVTDTLHDGLGGAIWFMTEAYLRSPVVSPQVADTARRIRATFIPALNELNATYATEAHAALQRKELLEQHRDALESLPVAENKTLFDWTKAFVEAGERLHQLLSDRADAAEGSRKEAGALRAGTIGMLNRLRGTLADEVEHDTALPRDLDDQVFGYFDELHAPRVAAARRAKGKQDEGSEAKGE